MMRKKWFILSRFSDTRRGRGKAEFIFILFSPALCLQGDTHFRFLSLRIPLALSRSPTPILRKTSSFLSGLRNYFYYLCAAPEKCIIFPKTRMSAVVNKVFQFWYIARTTVVLRAVILLLRKCARRYDDIMRTIQNAINRVRIYSNATAETLQRQDSVVWIIRIYPHVPRTYISI